ncbi:capsid cement protein [Mixta calida]|uniref:capsid cement protein n=1 Tax=Mixta calida TaxID=665913 RepID=UPI0034D5E326
MATNYVQGGTTLDFHNDTDAAIAAGDAVAVGGLVGVAHDNIPAGLWGVLHMKGVFMLPKTAGAIQQGQQVWLNADNQVTALSDDNLPLAGRAWTDAGADDDEVAVRLGY